MAELFGQSGNKRRNSHPAGNAAAQKDPTTTVAPKTGVFRIPSNISIKLGLQWSFIGDNPVDLDVSCVAFDNNCQCVEAIFFGHLHAEEGYMIHTGDNTTGEDVGDDDESIIFHMGMIPSNVHYLMVCVTSYTGADFTVVSSAHMRVVNLATKEAVGAFQLGIVGKHTATLLCTFNRVDHPQGQQPSPEEEEQGLSWWELREINLPSAGYTFVDVLPRMLAMLDITEDEDIERCLISLPDYSLEKKEEDLSNVVLSQLKFGVGWDGENDLDACMIMVDRDSQYVDHVYAKYGKLKTRDHSTTHSGDKLNGYDVDGDDEFILVNLMKVDKRVHQIFFIVILYDGLASSLTDVPKTYARLANNSSPLDETPHKTLTRIDLNLLADFDPSGASTVMVPFICERTDSTHWRYHVRQQETLMTGRDWVDVVPFVRAYSALDVNEARWAKWRADIFPFSVKATFLGVRNLGPQEPHQFACHCSAWVCDQKQGKAQAQDNAANKNDNTDSSKPHDSAAAAAKAAVPASSDSTARRFKSTIVKNRERIEWANEAHVFTLTKMDIIRVMVYELAAVGHADISLAEYFPGEVPGQLIRHRSLEDNTPANPDLKLIERRPSVEATVDKAKGAATGLDSDNAEFIATVNESGEAKRTAEPEGGAINNNNNDNGASHNGSTNNDDATAAAGKRSSSGTNVEGGERGLTEGAMEDPNGLASPLSPLEALGQLPPPPPLYENTRGGLIMEGETIVDAWFPLKGAPNVTGEVRVRLERVPLVAAPKEKESGWCVVQ